MATSRLVRSSGVQESKTRMFWVKNGRRSLHHQLVAYSTLDETFLRPRVRGVRYMKPGLSPLEHRRESVLLDFRAPVRFISPQQHSGDQCLIRLNDTSRHHPQAGDPSQRLIRKSTEEHKGGCSPRLRRQRKNRSSSNEKVRRYTSQNTLYVPSFVQLPLGIGLVRLTRMRTKNRHIYAGR
jgi:hypothetical protein